MTEEEFRHQTERILMGHDEYPQYGYRPIEIRERVKGLLRCEQRLKQMKANDQINQRETAKEA